MSTNSVRDTEESGTQRLQKLLARAGMGSRRSCETLISDGRVTVDGRIASLGERANVDTQNIEVDGRPLPRPPTDLTIVLNKPPGYVVSTVIKHEQKSIYDLLSGTPSTLRYIGRLDIDTEGVLLFSTIGELVHRLSHPRYEVKKVYEATVRGVPSDYHLDQLRSGIMLEDGMTAPAGVEFIETGDNKAVLRLTIHEGRKRQVRRMFRAIGHSVARLRRTAFGPITLEDLSPGTSRMLLTSELSALHTITQLQTHASPKSSN